MSSKFLIPVRIFQILISLAVIGLIASIVYQFNISFTYEGETFTEHYNSPPLNYGLFVGAFSVIATTAAIFLTNANPVAVVIIDAICWAAWAAWFSVNAVEVSDFVKADQVLADYGYDDVQDPFRVTLEAALGLSVGNFLLFCVTLAFAIRAASRKDTVATKSVA